MRAGIAIAVFLAALAQSQVTLNGPQLIAAGRFDDALKFYQTALEGSPKSQVANNGAGVALDLMGRYSEAQPSFEAAIRAAKTPLDRALARRAAAIGRGFAGDCRGAEKYEEAAFTFYRETGDFYNAGEVADELGRICLDTGDTGRAMEWYRKCWNTGLSEPDISAARKDLWTFRWAHARARIAAREGKAEEAWKFVRQAKAILEKRTNPAQDEFLPYLEGYAAFYAGDYARAVASLANAAQDDPFIMCLTGQAYEGLGDREKALTYYRRAAASTAHSVPAAYAKPFATRKLQ